MGLIRNQENEIVVFFDPDEIITERVPFRHDRMATIGQAVIYAARQRLIGTKIEHVETDAVSVKFQDGRFVVTMIKKTRKSEKEPIPLSLL